MTVCWGRFIRSHSCLIAFAFLGSPRTTRQSAAWAIGMVILGVSGLRLIGFASTVFTVKYPIAALVQYVAVFGSMATSLYMISRALTIEQPAFLSRAVNAASEWLIRRAGAVVKWAQ